MPAQKKLVPISQAAKVLGVSIDTVRRWDKAGTLHSTRPDGKNRYFSIDELESHKLSKPLSIGEASEKLGISQSTLRRLEKKKVIKPSRGANSERIYDKKSLVDFLHSEYFLRQKKVQEEILEPLHEEKEIKPEEQNAGVGSQEITANEAAKLLGVSIDKLNLLEKQGLIHSIHSSAEIAQIKSRRGPTLPEEAAQVEIEIQREIATSVTATKKVLRASGGVLLGYVLLVAVFTGLFFVYPEETGEFFGYRRPIVVVNKNNVLGAEAPSNQTVGGSVGAILKPLSAASLVIVQAVSPATYEKAVPTQTIEIQGSIGQTEIPGPSGANGANGADGLPGLTGPQGTAGQSGSSVADILTLPGSIIIRDGTNTTVPLNAGSNGQVLTISSGIPVWENSIVGGSGITSLDGLSGVLTISNTSGSGSTITIDNAAADGSTKGISAFSATNFLAASGIINTIQGISISATPTFAGLTVTGTLSGSNFSGSSSGTNTGDQTITLTGDVTGSGTGSFATTIQADSVALTTDTTGNYVATGATGNGISLTGGGSEGATLTAALGALISDWDQTGAFDISLNNSSSELKILESGGSPSLFGVFDVGDLSSADSTYTFSGSSGIVLTTTNYTGSLDSAYVNVGENPSAGDVSGSFSGGLTLGNNTVDDSELVDALTYTGAFSVSNLSISDTSVPLTGSSFTFDFNTAATRTFTITNSDGSNVANLSVEGTVLGSNLSGTNTGDQTITLTGDVTGSGTGSFATTIQADSVALGTDTTNNYVATITAGNGISGSSTTEGGTPSIALSTLIADWDQTGAFDISLNNSSSELKILESGGTPTLFGIFDVGDLSSSDSTFTFSGSSGTVLTSANYTGTLDTVYVNVSESPSEGDISGSFSGGLTLGANTVDDSELVDSLTYTGALSVGNLTISDTNIPLTGSSLTLDFNNATDRTLTIANSAAGIANLSVDGTISSSNFSGTSSGTNTGDQTITLTGDVTGSGTGSFGTTIADNAVDGTDISLTSEATGDVMYFDGSDWVRLAVGTGSQCLKGGTIPSWGACAGASGNSFETIDTPAGSDPVADSSTDSLQLLATGTNLTITGANDPESVTFNIDESVLAGLGLVANGSALDVGAGNGISVAADSVAVDQAFGFTLTGNNTFTPSGTNDLTINTDADSTLTEVFSSATNGTSGHTASITNSATTGTVAVNGYSITPNGTSTSGTNTINALLFNAPGTPNSNIFYGLNFGTGYDDILRYNGAQIISGTGLLQSAGLSGTYSNTLTLSGASNSITAGTLTATGGSINGTTIGASVPSSGAFTTLSGTGDITMNDAGADNILIGAAADTVTITSNTLSLTDDNWSIGTGGAAAFGSVTEGGTALSSKYAPIAANFVTVTANGTLTGETGIDALTTAISTTNTLNVDSSSTLNTTTIDANANFAMTDGTGTFVQTFSPLGTTATANGLAVTPKFTLNAVDQTLSSIYVNPNTNSNNDAGDILYGLNIDNITGSTAVETGIRVGTGWDTGIDTNSTTIVNIGNSGTDFDSSGGLTLASTLVLSNNTITCTSCVDVTDIGPNAVDDSEIVDVLTYTGTLNISTNALAVNSDSITSDGATLTINAAGNVDIQDALNADSITSDAGVSIAAGQSYTGAGAVTLSSSGTNTLTVQPTSTGQVVITSSNASASALDLNATGTVAGNAITLDTTDGGIALTAAGASNGDITLAATDDININGTAGSLLNIGTSAVTQTITLGAATNTDLVLTDANWSVTGAGVANFVSVGATTAGTGAFTTLSATGDVTMNDAGADNILIGAAADTVTITSNTLSLTDDNWSIGTGGAAAFNTISEGGTSLASKYAPIAANFVTITANGTLTGETGIDALSTAISTTSTLNVDSTSTLNTTTLDAGANLTLTAGVGTITQNFQPLGTTAAANGLTVTPLFTLNATDQTLSSIYVNPNTNSNNDAGDTLYGLNIENITGSTAVETGVRIGTGWDTGIDTNSTTIVNIGNSGTDFDSSGGLTLASTLVLSNNTITCTSCVDATDLGPNSVDDSEIVDALTYSGTLTISTNALAINSDSITSDGATLTINAAGNVDVQDALNADSITSDAGVSIAAGNSYTGAGAVTVSSAAGANALTLDSGTTGTVNLGTGNNAKTIAIGTGTAGNIINVGTNNTTLDTISIGSTLDNVAITGDQWSITDAGVLTVASCTGCGGGGATLQIAYDAGNTITTDATGDVTITLSELGTPTTFEVFNNDTAGTAAIEIDNTIGSGTLTQGLFIEQTGAGTMTSAIQITETAGTITTGITLGASLGTGINAGNNTIVNIGNAGTDFDSSGGLTLASTLVLSNNTITCTACIDVTDIGSAAVDDSELADTISYTGALTIATSALAVNSDSITSDGATLTINAAGAVDIQDSLTVDSLTVDTDATITGGDVAGANTESLDIGEADNGSFIFTAAGETNNESIEFDLETAANTLSLFSSTGVTSIDFGSSIFLTNIGNAGTDFDSSGGLTLASTLVLSNNTITCTACVDVTDLGANSVDDSELVDALTYTGALTLTPGSSTDFVVNGDQDSNVQLTNALTSDGTSVNLLDFSTIINATAGAATIYGINIAQADNTTNTAVVDAIARIQNANVAETTTNGLLIEQTGAGTLTNAIQIAETAGTITDGILITGTLGNILNSATIDITGAGAITGATGVTTTTLSSTGTSNIGSGTGTVTIDGTTLAIQTTGAGSDMTINAVDQIILTDFTTCTALETVANVLTCGTDDSGGGGAFTVAGGIIDKSTSTDRLRLQYGDAGDVQFTIENTTSSTIPTVDAVQIDLTGNTTGIVTDGVDGISIAMETGNGTTNTNSGLHVVMTPVNTPSGDENVYGVNLELTSATSALEHAIRIGANWDQIINNNGTLISGAELNLLDTKTGTLIDDGDLTSGDGAGASSSGSGMEAGTGGIGLLQGCTDNQILVWNESASTWGCAARGDIQDDTFTANGTYTKPAGAILVIVQAVGAGGGGGGGEGGTTAAIRSGAGGGGGGTYKTKTFEAAAVGATETITVPSTGGAGGGSSAVDGTAGGNSSFGTLVVAYGGGGGGVVVGAGGGGGGGGGAGSVGSNSTTGTGGVGGGPVGGAVGASLAGAGGAGGGTSAATPASGGSGFTGGGGGGSASSNGTATGATGGSSLSGGAAGGGGGSCPITTFVARNGGVGGARNSGVNGGGAAGGVGGATGTAGTAGTAGDSGYGGGGGGGGGNSSAATGGAGGAGGAPGGGGGGGACGQTTTGGAGGVGGRGEINVWTIKGSGADLAEIYSTTDESLGAGDVVSLDPSLIAGVKKSTKAYDGSAIGIISTQPSLVMGSVEDAGAKPALVALSGRVPVKVSNENGAIKPGDFLTSSSTPGVAMRATKAGQVLGQAMIGFEGEEQGLIVAFIKTDSYKGANLADFMPGLVDGKVALLSLVQQKAELTDLTNLSEITTDRITAGLEIITPKLIADEIVVRRIKAEQIEGLTFLAEQIISEKFIQAQNVLGSQTDTESTEIVPTETNLVVDSLLTNKGLTVLGPAEFKGETLFEKLATFITEVVFRGNVSFLGRATFNKDTAGFAVVKKGASEVEVKFEKEYVFVPVVVATPDQPIVYSVVSSTTKGFTIKLNENITSADITFNWIALATNDTKTTISDQPTQTTSTPIPMSEPTPEPSFVPVPTIDPTPSSTQTQTLTILSNELGYVRIRDLPTAESAELGQIPSGEVVAYSEITDDWYKIEYNGAVGWVSGTYVEVY